MGNVDRSVRFIGRRQYCMCVNYSFVTARQLHLLTLNLLAPTTVGARINP